MSKKIIKLTFLIFALSVALCLASCENLEEDYPILFDGVPTHSHVFGEWGSDSATCTEHGLRERKCSICDEVEVVLTVALGHDMISYKDRAADCTESGCIGYSACSRCEYFEGELIEAHGHKMSNWVVTLEATCVNEGSQTKTCSICTETVTESIKHLGHAMVKYTDCEATCTTEGCSGYKKCSRCDYYEGEKFEPLGHDMSEWTTVTEPTCTEGGTEKSVCERGCNYEQTRDTDPLGHTPNENGECDICHIPVAQ